MDTARCCDLPRGQNAAMVGHQKSLTHCATSSLKQLQPVSSNEPAMGAICTVERIEERGSQNLRRVTHGIHLATACNTNPAFFSGKGSTLPTPKRLCQRSFRSPLDVFPGVMKLGCRARYYLRVLPAMLLPEAPSNPK